MSNRTINVLHVDTLIGVGDDELRRLIGKYRDASLRCEEEKDDGRDLVRYQTELCYLQREREARSRRYEAHRVYLQALFAQDIN